MVEFFFFFFFFFFFYQLWLVVVSGCGGYGWMWRSLFAMIFFFSFFVSGGCGMGGGFLVGDWEVGFVVTVGSVALAML